MALKDWKVKSKSRKYTVYYNKKRGETVPFWHGKPAQNKKAKEYMRSH